jgi:hypothetical protein
MAGPTISASSSLAPGGMLGSNPSPAFSAYQANPNDPRFSGGLTGSNPSDPNWIPSQQFTAAQERAAFPGMFGPAPTAGATAGGGQDYAALIKQYQDANPSLGTDPNRMQGLAAFLQAHGVAAAIATHAGGTAASDDKIVMPDGTYYDVASDNGWSAPGQPDHWDPSVNVVGPNGQTQSFSSYLQGQGLPVPAFNPRPDELGGGSGSAGYAGPGGMGGLIAPFTGQFSAPDLNNTTDPGYLARLQMGTDAIQKSAAAKGTLLTGGTLKDLTNYAQDYASNEYGNVYGRAANTFNTNYGIFENNQANAFNRLYGLTGLGLNAAGQANSALSGYGAGLGNNAALYGGLQQGYANNLGNLYTGIGNTNAAAQLANGQIGAGMVGGLGTIGAAATPYIYQALRGSGYGPKPPALGTGTGSGLSGLPGYTNNPNVLGTPPPGY